MNKELEGHDSPALDQSGEPPERRRGRSSPDERQQRGRQKTSFSTAARYWYEPDPHKGQEQGSPS